tara:strand:+ start:5394 stop:7106 length:1713 start_codon:yes stop_codon:yes gene_type:complete
MEVIGLFSIVPFFYLILNSDIILDYKILLDLYVFLNFNNIVSLLIFISFVILIFYVSANLFSLYANYQLIKFSNEFQISMSNQVYQRYINKNWEFFLHTKTSEATRNLLSEVSRVVQGIIQPILNINNRLFLILLLITSLLIYNPLITILIFFIYLVIYFTIYQSLKKTVLNYGNKISLLSTSRYQIITETFGSIKEILISGSQKYFYSKYSILGNKFGTILSKRELVTLAPKYLIEITSFIIIVSIILILYIFNSNDTNHILLNLSVFSISAYKLIPNFQAIYSSVVQINSNIPAFLNLREDLITVHKTNLVRNQIFKFNKNNKKIIFQNINFFYKSSNSNFLIKNLSLEVPLNSILGFVGKTGSGKSTIADLIANLINPDSGKIYLANNTIQNQKLSKYFFSYVPQNPFFLDGTILENIAFGIQPSKINFSKLKKAAKLACLDDFMKIDKKSDFDIVAGENSRRLSGGQKQRIAIARAIFANKPIMIFDESTSALDAITERKIIKNLSLIQKQNRNTILFITHKISNLLNCKLIYIVDRGKISNSGTYDYLLNNDKYFMKLSNIKKNV